MKIRVGRTRVAVVHVRRVLLAMTLFVALGALGRDRVRRSVALPFRSEEPASLAQEDEPAAHEPSSPYRAIPVRGVPGGHLRLFPDFSGVESWTLFERFRGVRNVEFDPGEAGYPFARLDEGGEFVLLASSGLEAQAPNLILHLQPRNPIKGISQGSFSATINGETLNGFYSLSYG